MAPEESNTKIKESKVNTKPEQQGIPQKQYYQNKLDFTLRYKFSKACESMTGKKLSENRPDDFKGTLDNIKIYAGEKYGHAMGMKQNACTDDTIQKPEDPYPDIPKYAKYIETWVQKLHLPPKETQSRD